ncbi:MAG: hypothetical protein ACRYFU_16020 [Janthinobacterium lividum]
MIAKLRCGILLFLSGATAQAQVSSPDVYLLAASSGAAAPAAALYRLRQHKKLVPERTVTPGNGGNLRVIASEDTLFVLHPDVSPNVVSVIHKNSPQQAEDLPLTLPEVPVEEQMVVGRTAGNAATELLIPLPGTTPGAAGVLFSIDAQPSASPRVQDASKTTFSMMDFEGHPASAFPETALVAWNQRGAITEARYPNLIYDAHAPANLQLNEKKGSPDSTAVVASSRHWLLLLAAEPATIPPRSDTALYVHDRQQDRWSQLRVDGSSNSSMRLFGDWLAVRVELSSDRTGVQSSAVHLPGKGHESTDHLRNYSRSYFPGYLLLHNLHDGREVRVKTGVADSEVEAINGDSVTYRVGSSLLRGHIAGKNVVGSEVIAQDPAIVNVHWIFPAVPFT